MPWIRFEDNFPEHPKVLALSDAAFRLHVRAIGYAARHLTDGHVSSAALRSMTRNPALPAALVGAGIWETATDGFLVHDYLHYQPSKAEVVEQRMAKKAAGKKGADSRWHGK